MVTLASSAHPHAFSGPPRELHQRPQWQGSHGDPRHFATFFTRFVAPLRSSTEDPSGRFRIVTRLIAARPSRISWPPRELHQRPQWQASHGDPRHVGTPLTHSVVPKAAAPKAPSGTARMVTRPIAAHPSRASWPHWAPHRGPQSQRSQVA